MPIPNAARAVIPREKLTDYLLNVSHPVGGSKARWFISLGYRPSRMEQLAADLLNLVLHQDEFTLHRSPFGVKYIVRGRIATPSGRLANVATVWIAEPNAPRPRLVTAFPGEEASDE